MGKTALATNMAFHAARAYVQDMEAGAEVPRGAPVLFFSLEMAAQQLSARILSEQTEIEMWKIRNGRFSESEWEKFVLTMQDLPPCRSTSTTPAASPSPRSRRAPGA